MADASQTLPSSSQEEPSPDLAVLLSSSDLPVRQVAQTNILTCTPETPLHEAATRLRGCECSSILVVDGGDTVGIWTERDTLTVDFTSPEAFHRPVRDAMSQPVKSVPPDLSLEEVAARFANDGVRHYLVAEEDGQRIGVISQTDVVYNQGLEHYLRLVGVDSVVQAGTVVVEAALPLDEAVATMRRARRDALVVAYADGGYGSLTERDLVRFVAEQVAATPVGELANRPLITVAQDYSLLQVRKVLQEHGIRHLGVTDEEGRLLGLVGLNDLLSGMELSYIQELQEAFRERDQALVQARQNLNLAEKVIESSMEGVMITDPRGNIQSVNPAFTQITGYTQEEVVGAKPSVLSSGLHGPDFYQAMWEAIRRDGYWQGEIWNRRKDGQAYPQLLTITAIANGGDGQ